ncbi:MotA/TolQ/ExbB proton channel family protein [Ideonella sp. 4Y16]|uniref:MotA/TolQ/ExbB proton channel family protein n=1 Tax=Ideonella alba TaxID=2824118 RepID=UPI001B3615C9|nr:MotA/TolQ/ExbB proton channel family protein [Ideonella alba]MBQ0943263.1 MotA/TolQ/ExbB proton channel family protein [Ideonella alba]
MDGLAGFWAQSDAIGRTVAALLLLMSIGAWVVILWKVWVLRRARRGLVEGIAAFWEAPDLAQASARAAALDPEGLLRPLIDAAAASAPAGTLQDRAQPGDQLTRRLRDALHRALAHLQTGQVFLASVGSTAPFIGLFGTVWGIYHALLGLGTGGAISIERIAGPVGEALVMTAAGLAVAIPAVLAYNLFGKWVGACEAELEGFAHDLRGLALAS